MANGSVMSVKTWAVIALFVGIFSASIGGVSAFQQGVDARQDQQIETKMSQERYLCDRQDIIKRLDRIEEKQDELLKLVLRN